MQYALILAHFLGDYTLQSHKMSISKTTDMKWAIIHAYVYSLPFCVLLGYAEGALTWQVAVAWVVVMWTHAVIDRYGLARRWCVWYGVGHPGIWWTEDDRKEVRELAAQKLYETWTDRPNWCPWVPRGNSLWQDEARRATQSADFEYPPPFLQVWLQIIVDNTLHLAINGLTFWWLQG